MSIKPILFNTDMVRAILDGRKTVTRRIVKHDVDAVLSSPYHKEHPEVSDKQIISKLCMPPYQPGDILYVRETWCDDRQFTNDSTPGRYFYKASESDDFKPKWRPSIHMPKEAARIFLKVTNVRVERLMDIRYMDCIHEGVSYKQIERDVISEFSKVWNSTIKKSDIDIYGWNADPWVWVIEFERCEKPGGLEK